MTITPEPVWSLGCALGEGPVWLADEQALRFVDIKKGNLHRWVPATGAAETIEVGGEPSFIVPVSDGGLLVGSGHGIYRLVSDQLGAPLATVDMPAHNRTNDATVAPDGRLWFGTMDNDEGQPTGSIWCLDRGALHQSDTRAVVSNGPAVSTDGRTLYHVNSGERTIWRCPIDNEPVLGSGELFIRLGEDEGCPDGIVVDSEDCLWVALWDGWGVRRYAPDGTLLLHVAFPCARVTKVAFGGPDLKTAYVTTARIGLNKAVLAAQPLAGALFSFAAPIAGQALPSVRLT
ncbi:MAG: SMP-30/gluconolactonase/LRE family protein [Novosphingobium sp.]